MSTSKLSVFMRCIHMPNIKLLSAICEKLWPMLKLHFFTFNLTFDLEGWPWPWHFTHQNVRLDVTHMYAKYQVAICNRWKVMTNVKVACFWPSIWPLTLKDDLDMPPFKVSVLKRWIHMPNTVKLRWLDLGWLGHYGCLEPDRRSRPNPSLFCIVLILIGRTLIGRTLELKCRSLELILCVFHTLCLDH